MKKLLNIPIISVAFLAVCACSTSNIETSKKDILGQNNALLEKTKKENALILEELKREDLFIKKYIPFDNYTKSPVDIINELWANETSFCKTIKIPEIPNDIKETNEIEVMFEIHKKLKKETGGLPKMASAMCINLQVYLTDYIYNYYKKQEIETIKEKFNYKKASVNFLLELIKDRPETMYSKSKAELIYTYKGESFSCVKVLQSLDNGYLIAGDLNSAGYSYLYGEINGSLFAKSILESSKKAFVETELNDKLTVGSTLPSNSYYLYLGEKSYTQHRKTSYSSSTSIVTLSHFKKIPNSYLKSLIEGKLFLNEIDDIFDEIPNICSTKNHSTLTLDQYKKFKGSSLANQTLANKGDAVAQFELAKIYFNINNLEQAKAWAEKSINNGNKQAHHILALLSNMRKDYRHNIYKEREINNETIKHYKIAGDAGYADAQFKLAIMLEENANRSEDVIYWYEKAVALNHSGAMNNLANIYFREYNYYKDSYESKKKKKALENRDKALALYMKGDKLGESICALNLARYYGNFYNREKDLEKSEKYYLKAATDGNVKAMQALANLYRDGSREAPLLKFFGVEAVKKDIKKAEYWYQKAGNKGDIESIKILAEGYNGGIFEKNVEKARYWREKLTESTKTKR